MKLKLSKFNGIKPVYDAEKLPATNATVAINCDFRGGGISPLKAPTEVETLPDALRTTIYPYDDAWLSWEPNVDVVPSPLNDDEYNRIYYTGDGVPKVRFQKDDVTYEKTIGVPKPTNTLTASVSNKTETTWTRKWSWYYENADGDRVNDRLLSIRTAEYRWIESASGTSEFYLQYSSDSGVSWGNPLFNEPDNVWEDATGTPGDTMTPGTVGSLSADEWDWGDNDSLGYSTIYVRLTGSTDPDAGVINSMVCDSYVSDRSRIGGITEETAGEEYKLLSTLIPKAISIDTFDVSGYTKFVLYFTANSSRGAILGRVFPDLSVRNAVSDLYIDGAKVTAEQNESGDRTFTLNYDTTEQSEYTTDRSYVFTFVNEIGEEGPPSTASALVAVEPNKNVDLSVFDVAQPDGGYITIENVRIYRTVQATDGSTTYNYVKEVSFGTGSTTDDLLGSELGTAISTTGRNPPPEDLSGLVSMPGEFFAGFVGKALYLSEQSYPSAWLSDYIYYLDYDIVGLAVSGNTIFVSTTGRPYVVAADTPGGVYINKLAAKQSGTNKRAMVEFGGAIIYASTDGLAVASGTIISIITEDIYSKDQWDALGLSDMILAEHDGYIYVFGSESAISLKPGNTERGAVSLTADVSGIYHDLEADILYVIIGDKIYSWATGSNYTFEWTSKTITIDRPISFNVGRVIQDDECDYTVKIDGEDDQSRTVSDSTAFYLSKTRRDKKWAVTVSGDSKIDEVLLSTGIMDL